MTRPYRPRVDILARNILAVYADASDDERQAGREWYADAHTLARELDPDNVERAAGVIAALSPRLSWDLNARYARQAYADGRASGGLKANTDKATRILAGEPPANVLGGRKVTAFADNIARPGTSERVTIDRHAFDIARGRVTSDAEREILSRKGVYDVFCEAYRRVAHDLGDISPAQLQAVTWVAWRRRKGLVAA
jgi:hypothetical protein